MAKRWLHLVRHGEAIDDGDLSPTGRDQARRLAERLATVPLTRIHHGPLPRATQTAEMVAASMPGVPVRAVDILGDYVPPVPEPATLPGPYARFLAAVTAEEFADGATRADAAIEAYARPAEVDTHELIVTHSFLVGWFVRHALDAPAGRWLGLNPTNCGLTTILYRSDRPPALVTFNDQSHLPPGLRWTGFPAHMRPEN